MLTAGRIRDRAVIVLESDAVCDCGADPRANNGAAITDPAWWIDAVLYPEPGGYTREAEIVCPRCLAP